MATQVLRFETRDRLDPNLLRHCAGESRPDHARPGRKAVVFHDDRDGARARLDALLEARKGSRGRPPKQAIDMILAGPPAYAADDAWPADRVDEWARASYEWVRETFPEAPVAIAVLHTDEASPHIHVVLIPEHKSALSWHGLKTSAAGRFNHYRKFQDSYYERIGKAFELARGERGSQRKHKPLDRESGLKRARQELDKGLRLQAMLKDAAEAAEAAGKPGLADEIRAHAEDPEAQIRVALDRARADGERRVRQARRAGIEAAQADLDAELEALARERAEAVAQRTLIAQRIRAARTLAREVEAIARKKTLRYLARARERGRRLTTWLRRELAPSFGVPARAMPAVAARLEREQADHEAREAREREALTTAKARRGTNELGIDFKVERKRSRDDAAELRAALDALSDFDLNTVAQTSLRGADDETRDRVRAARAEAKSRGVYKTRREVRSP